MNWARKIGEIIGKFWTRLFGGRDFILAVENAVGLAASRHQALLDRWLAERAMSLDGKYQDRLPYVLLLRKTCISKDAAGTPVAAVDATGGLTPSPLQILNDPAMDVSTVSTDRGYALRMLYLSPAPAIITDHALDSTVTLFSGLDYVYDGDGWLRFFVDPSGLGWPTMLAQDSEGNTVECYRLFGWMRATDALEDAVAAFESPELAGYARDAWDIHQNGATVLSAKRLLADVTGSVVCVQDGEVKAVWTEDCGTLNCAIIGDRLYSSRSAPASALEPGNTLAAGDTVFGDMTCYPRKVVDDNGVVSYGAPSASEIPGVHVMTGVGELFADNSDSMSADSFSGTRVLPLRLNGLRSDAYGQECARLQAAGAPSIEVPAKLNPCRFVIERLRAGGCFLACVTASSLRELSAAMACLRRSAVAGGVSRVYVRAAGEGVSAHVSSVSAAATGAAVAVSVSARVSAAAANARVTI